MSSWLNLRTLTVAVAAVAMLGCSMANAAPKNATPAKKKAPTAQRAKAKPAAKAKLAAAKAAAVVDENALPQPMREFRGAWVATVANIDWPSTTSLTTKQQQDELIAIMDKCKELNMNCVVFQVRPACDALYASELEPWSPYLTGEMGKAPEPFYDPLAMTVDEAHKRGMELHTWFNPYRALLSNVTKKVSDNHLSKTNPRIVKQYGEFMWMDPSDKETQAHSLAVVLDVVKRYDIDGIHVDDYFYPYPIANPDVKGEELQFPDEENYNAYVKAGGKMSRNDWRRDGVNKFIKSFYDETKKMKPWVKVGISPFGMLKPGIPAHIKGFDQYDKLYADARLWLHKGWIDYYTPQLYWPISNPDQSFVSLLQWWVDESAKTSKRPIWPGMFTGKFNDKKNNFGSDEIIHQIKWSRILEKQPGQVHFSMKTFFSDPDKLNDKLTSNTEKHKGPYALPAVVPAMPWLDRHAPAAPKMTTEKDGATILGATWEPAKRDAQDTRFWLVQYKDADGTWTEEVIDGRTMQIKFKPEQKVERLAVRAIDRSSNLGKPADTK